MLLLLLACDAEPDAEVVLLEGFDFGWRAFNHRISALDAGTEAVAVVGGTSTTGVTPSLDDTCDPDTCKEFPFTDTADIWVRTRTVTAAGLTSAAASASLSVGAAGASTTVSFDAPPPEGWEPVIVGLEFVTTGPEGCYDPAFGWLPTELAVAVEAAGDEARVTASFAAGLSLEEVRACLDAVAGEATITLQVELLALSGVPFEKADFNQGAEWGEVDGEWEVQTPPPAEDVHLPDARAFQSLAWTFHEGDADGRGAYLRTLGVDAEGRGWATNSSPGTQLSGFSYRFTGGLLGFDGEGEAREATAAYTPALDAAGAAIPVVPE